MKKNRDKIRIDYQRHFLIKNIFKKRKDNVKHSEDGADSIICTLLFLSIFSYRMTIDYRHMYEMSIVNTCIIFLLKLQLILIFNKMLI